MFMKRFTIQMRHKVSCRDLQVSNNVTALGFMPNLHVNWA